MTQNDTSKILKCIFCNYETMRKYNLERHHRVKHINKNNEESGNKKKEENVIQNGENVPPNGENVPPNCENVPQKFICNKCNKTYKHNRYLLQHEKICKGIDGLTCPKCMITFSTRQHKYNHIKRNNCKARSIIYAKKFSSEIKNKNFIQNQNVTNYNITNYNIINNNTTNNVFINNYGNERLDYLNYEKMLEIFKKAYDIPSLLTKEIHFNNNFPENNNILYKNENTSLIKTNNDYMLKDLNNLVKELITEKSKFMQKFAIENKDDICLKIDTNIYEDIIELLLNLILLKEPSEHYKNQVINIRDIIKNSNNI